MRYWVSQNDTAGRAVGQLSSQQVFVERQGLEKRSAKWPLWRTVVGVTVICSTFWTLIFQLIF